MGLVQWMQPRDHRVAGRTASVLGLVAAAVTLVFAVGQLVDDEANAIDIVVTVVAAAPDRAWPVGPPDDLVHAHPRVWAVWPFAATGLIVALDFLTGDATPVGPGVSDLPGAVRGVRTPPTRRDCGGRRGGGRRNGRSPRRCCRGSGPSSSQLHDGRHRHDGRAAHRWPASARRRLVTLLERQAAIDPLTGLVTRRVLDDAASAALSGAASGDGTALILIDVDNFKAINDTYGHPGGDEVLVQLAAGADRAAPGRPTW